MRRSSYQTHYRTHPKRPHRGFQPGWFRRATCSTGAPELHRLGDRCQVEVHRQNHEWMMVHRHTPDSGRFCCRQPLDWAPNPKLRKAAWRVLEGVLVLRPRGVLYDGRYKSAGDTCFWRPICDRTLLPLQTRLDADHGGRHSWRPLPTRLTSAVISFPWLCPASSVVGHTTMPEPRQQAS